LEDEGLFALAGVWDQREKGGRTVQTFAIITTGASVVMRPIHHRMPVILSQEDERRGSAFVGRGACDAQALSGAGAKGRPGLAAGQHPGEQFPRDFGDCPSTVNKELRP